MSSERHGVGLAARNPELLDKRYALGELLGQGAFADVHAATHVYAGTEHAIKRWRIRLSDSDEARWKREILAPLHIGHPAVVIVVDAGVDERHRPFAVMERLRGEDLEKRLARGPLTLDEALDVFEQLLDALAAAHAAGIVHRDLKPANVFLEVGADRRRRVRLLDFGCALPLDLSITRITGSGVAVGTLSHMAPEQVLGAPVLGPTTDVWAAGVIIYEALAGRAPFDERTVEGIITAICRGAFIPLVHAAPHVPEIIGALVSKCLCVGPEQRYADARVLQQAWSALRATRRAWQRELVVSLEDAETSGLWSGTGMPLPAYARTAAAPVPAEPAAAFSAKQPPIPATRPSQQAYAGPVRLDPITAEHHPRFGSEHPSASTARSGYFRRRRSTGGVLLLMSSAVLTALVVVVAAARDTVIVPALEDASRRLGYAATDGVWTLSVVSVSLLVALLAALCFVLAVQRLRRSAR